MPRIVTPLTDTAIRKPKATDGPVKLRDGRGLFIQINVDGSKWWRMDYSHPITGKRNTLSLGTYPDVTLAEARLRLQQASKALASGIYPGEQRKAQKSAGIESASNSFAVVTREWLGKQNWVPSYKVKVQAWMENDVFP